MKEVALKVDLYDKIEHANMKQLKELYGLVTNYFNGSQAMEEWDTLPELQRKLITKSLEQADAGLGISLTDINNRLRQKHGLND